MITLSLLFNLILSFSWYYYVHLLFFWKPLFVYWLQTFCLIENLFWFYVWRQALSWILSSIAQVSWDINRSNLSLFDKEGGKYRLLVEVWSGTYCYQLLLYLLFTCCQEVLLSFSLAKCHPHFSDSGTDPEYAWILSLVEVRWYSWSRQCNLPN